MRGPHDHEALRSRPCTKGCRFKHYASVLACAVMRHCGRPSTKRLPILILRFVPCVCGPHGHEALRSRPCTKGCRFKYYLLVLACAVMSHCGRPSTKRLPILILRFGPCVCGPHCHEALRSPLYTRAADLNTMFRSLRVRPVRSWGAAVALLFLYGQVDTF